MAAEGNHAGKKQIRLLLVDDHPLILSALRRILDTEPSFVVVGEARDGLEAITSALQLRPDVILMDNNMPRCSGIEAMIVIRGELPEVRVLFLTASDSEDDLAQMLRNGAQGYLPKSASIDDVVEAVKKAADGDALFPQHAGPRRLTISGDGWEASID